MKTLADIRREHPGYYDDLSDDQLAQRIHARHYADMPFPEFARRIGLRGQRGSAGYSRAYNAAQQNRERMRQAQGPMAGFNDFIDQTVGGFGLNDEMAGAGAWLSQSLGNLANRVQGRPQGLPADVVSQAARDYERDRQARYAQEHPDLNAAAIVASIPAGGGTPAAGAGRIGALRAGLGAAAIDAPFAVGRQEGELQERLPGAAREVATVGALGAGLTSAANVIAPLLAPRAVRIANAFERQGVDPSIATVNAGTFGGRMSGPVTNAIADNPVAGVFVRPRIGRQAEQAAEASRRIQAAAGQTRSPEAAGAVVQRGIRRYATDAHAPSPRPMADPRTIHTGDWTVPAQADAIFDHVLTPVANNPTSLQRTVREIAAIDALSDNDPVVLAFRRDPVLRDITDTAHELATRPNAPLTLRAARELRRRLRLQMDDVFAGGQDNASLKRVYSALTRDIYDAAGPAARDLRRADLFYERRMRNISEALHDFDPRHGADPSQSFMAIIRAADRTRGNVRQLVALRNALRPAEMNTLRASLIEHMGQPAKSAGGTQAADLGFSVNSFSTAWDSMSPLARRTLFGSSNSPLLRDLEDLATIARQMKGVERTANASQSGNYIQFGTTMTGLVAAPAQTLMALTGMVGVGEALTRPSFVRWLVSASRSGQGVGGMRRQLAALARLASRDPALAPFYTELSQRLERQFAGPASTPPQRREPVQ